MPKPEVAALEQRHSRRSAWTGEEDVALVPQHPQGGMSGKVACTVPGCERIAEVLKRVLCRTHYSWPRNGRPLHAPMRAIRKERGPAPSRVATD